MNLLVIRTDLSGHAGHVEAAGAYGRALEPLFDRVVANDVRGANGPGACDVLPFPFLTEPEVRSVAARASFTLALSCTTPDRFARLAGAANVGLTSWETDRLPLIPSWGLSESPWLAPLNAMDAVWVPNAHTRRVFAAAGVTAPLRVVPCPLRDADDPAEMPVPELYHLDRTPAWGAGLARVARLQGNRFRLSRSLMRAVAPRLRQSLLTRLRSAEQPVPGPARQTLLCPAADGPRGGLRLLLSEWTEFKHRTGDAAWSLVVQTAPATAQAGAFDLVVSYWLHVQALKRQTGVRDAGVYLSVGLPSGPARDPWLGRATALVVPSLGEAFGGAALTALASGKPAILPRHTAFADYVPAEYPYAFESRPAMLSFLGGPDAAYDPTSAWQVPLPFALAEAMTRLASDPPDRRAAAVRLAQAYLEGRCGPERIHRVLAEEVVRLQEMQANDTEAARKWAQVQRQASGGR